MEFIYSTEVSLFSTLIREDIGAFSLFWNEFKNSVTVEIELIHLQPIN